MPFSHLFEKKSVQISGTGPFKCTLNLDLFRSIGLTLSKIVYDPFLLTQKKSKFLSVCFHCHLGHFLFLYVKVAEISGSDLLSCL